MSNSHSSSLKTYEYHILSKNNNIIMSQSTKKRYQFDAFSPCFDSQVTKKAKNHRCRTIKYKLHRKTFVRNKKNLRNFIPGNIPDQCNP